MESENMFMKRKGITAFFSCALFGISALLFGGTALAATMPLVGNLENKYIKGLAKPVGIAVDKESGFIYVSDPIDQVIHVYNGRGIEINRFGGIKVPGAIAVGPERKLYVIGYSSGSYTVFSLDKETGIQQGPVNITAGLQNPIDIAVDSNGNIYVVDGLANKILVFDRDGMLKNTIVPPAFFSTNETLTDSASSTSKPYARTRHSFAMLAGIAIDESRNEVYAQVREVVAQESDAVILSCSSVLDGSTNKYWTPVGDFYKVLAMDINSGNLISRSMLLRGFLFDSGSCNSTSSSGALLNPAGMAQDGKNRLYTTDNYWGIRVFDLSNGAALDGLKTGVAVVLSGSPTISINGTIYRYVDVTLPASMPDANYTVSSPAAVGRGGTTNLGTIYDPAQVVVTNKSVNSFRINVPSAWVPLDVLWKASYFSDATPSRNLSFDTINNRLIATVTDGNEVKIYGIDGGSNPGNNLPKPPQPISPANDSVIDTNIPTMVITGSYDADSDPLVYTYEISSSYEPITGKANGTTYTPSGPLVENAPYSWRARANDGDADSLWSDSAAFCVNAVNEPPYTPGDVSPVGGIASPFTTDLAWSASTDPDCNRDTISYTVEISKDDEFLSVNATTSGVSASPLRLGSIGLNLLKDGGTYYWRVRAVDNHGLESGYGSGSFVYKTTLVSFRSDPPGTEVYIDGSYGYPGRALGVAPVDVQDITPGLHFVTFIKAGYEPYYTIVDVKDPLKEPTLPVYAQMSKASRISLSSTGAVLAGLEVAGPSAPFVVNYTNDIIRLKDGLKDVIVGSGDGKVYLFAELRQEDGTRRLIPGDAVKADMADIDVGERAVPFVVDYNNDGKNDLLVGSDDGLVYLYMSEIQADDASKLAAKGALKDTDGNNIKVISNSAPTVVDYNGDGNKDLVVGSGDGYLVRYLNSGTDASPQFKASDALTINADGSALSIGVNSKAFFTDWNSDGKKDLVVGGGSGVVGIFLNVGTDNEPEFKSISDLQQWIKEKKRERGNREYIPYLGYNNDPGDLTNGKGDAAPFVVNWDGSSSRDLFVGAASGGIIY